MANIFAHLPPEVLLIILRNMRDLPSLYKFICASAQANAAFTIDAAHILHEIIERSIPDFQPLARMISILGSLDMQNSFNARSWNTSSPTFDTVVAKYRSLPEDVLTKAVASFSFMTGTSGPRYLLLTAYRIEHLQHICFTTLLQNIHELIFISPVNKHTIASQVHTLKHFQPGVFFRPAAWWSPSWVERFRIERALWKLFIHWNIRAIQTETIVDDPDFRQYNEKLQYLNPSIGPAPTKRYTSHEVEEMNCVSASVCEFLGCEPAKFFMVLSNQERKLLVTQACSKFSLNFKETAYWKFEEPKPPRHNLSSYWGQDRYSTTVSNSEHREYYWANWRSCSPIYDKLNLEKRDLWFHDYLGLCLWDFKRLLYLGLDYRLEEHWDPSLGHPKQPDIKFFSSKKLDFKWKDLFLHELVRLPGRRQRALSNECKEHIKRWNHTVRYRGFILDERRLRPRLLFPIPI